MKKVMFVIPALSGGGAERVVLYLLKFIDRKRYIPELVVFEKKGELLHCLPSDVKVYSLKKRIHNISGFQWLVFLELTRLFKRQQPDFIISFMWYTNFITLTAGVCSYNCLSNIIVSERYSISRSLEGRLVEWIRRKVIRFLYPKAKKVIANSEGLREELIYFCRLPNEKVITIYNPVDIEYIRNLSIEEVEESIFDDKIPIVLAIGRLTKQKGFDYLIKAIHTINSDGLKTYLVLLGQGREEERLKELVKKLQIEDRVFFLGFKNNPYKYLARATVFVLSSLYEGFPNVLLEAMALGVPSVATRCPTGPEEIITDGINGVLVPPADEKTLAEAIKRLLLDEKLRRRLSLSAKKRAEEFEVKRIVREFEEVILS